MLNRKKVFFIAGAGLLLAVLILLLCVLIPLSGDSGEDSRSRRSEKVTFEDPLVEYCVRKALDKDAEDSITRGECESIESLEINCALDASVIMNVMIGGTTMSAYVDLSDLQYLTELKELKIKNCPMRDCLANLDAITNCTELESLSLQFNPGIPSYLGDLPMGYKYLAELLEELPKLTYLDTGYVVAGEHQDMLRKEHPDLEIEDEYEVTNKDKITENTVGNIAEVCAEEYLEVWNTGWDSALYAVKVDDQEELEELVEILPEDIEVVSLQLEEGTYDFSVLKELTQMRSLHIIGARHAKGSVEYVWENLEELQDNTLLYNMSLSGVNGDWSELGRLTQLKCLSIGMCGQLEADFLSQLSGLQELILVTNLSDTLEADMEEQYPNLSNLKLLKASYSEDYRGIEKLENLESFYGFSFDAEMNTLKYIAECSKLENVLADLICEEPDIGSLKKLRNAEVLLIRDNKAEIVDGVEEILDLPNLICLCLPDIETNDMDAYMEDVNEWCGQVLEDSNLSCFIPMDSVMGSSIMLQDEAEGIKLLEKAGYYSLYEAGIFTYSLDYRLITEPEKYDAIEDIIPIQ